MGVREADWELEERLDRDLERERPGRRSIPLNARGAVRAMFERFAPVAVEPAWRPSDRDGGRARENTRQGADRRARHVGFISNSDRDGMISAVKEWLARQEAGLESDPAGPQAES